jgi:para-nitrobenzyl esterase
MPKQRKPRNAVGLLFGHRSRAGAVVAALCALSLMVGCSSHAHSGVEPADGGGQGAEADSQGAALEPEGGVDCGTSGASASGGDEGGAAADLLVTVADGQIQGDLVGGTRRFLKIPFAKPPTGDLRWKGPVKNEPWSCVRHETDFASACPQNMSSQGPASSDEDCLYLNVWAPEPAANKAKAPVMVWFHGGGNFAGSTRDDVPTTNQLWYDGQFFAARHGIVLVTTNYRLGVMGFFAHPALAGEKAPLGNQGLFDQRAALEWVQSNIAAFGGDPGNVTIFGESAGSADVCWHVASGVTGLFHRAISESGGCASTTIGGTKQQTSAEAAMGIAMFTQKMGCEAAGDQLACLRSKSVDDILANVTQPNPTGGTMLNTPFTFNVVVDGPGGFLPDQPRTLFDSGQIVHVPYILGSNNDEGMLFILMATIPTSDAQYRTALQSNFGAAFAPQVMAQYPVSRFNGDYRAALARVIGDSGLICGTHDTARRAAKAGLSVFMYNFNMPWAIAPTTLLASHASEISHVFGDPVRPSADDTTVSNAMNAFWANFAQTGDPNYSGAPAMWPAFLPDANDNDERLQLDAKWEVIQNFRKEDCAFWRGYYDMGFAGQ